VVRSLLDQPALDYRDQGTAIPIPFPPPPTAVRSPSVVTAPRGEHSAKPEVFAEMIERWYPESAKVEMFRRGEPRPGWAAWAMKRRPQRPRQADHRRRSWPSPPGPPAAEAKVRASGHLWASEGTTPDERRPRQCARQSVMQSVTYVGAAGISYQRYLD
jgi:hypothetical protein